MHLFDTKRLAHIGTALVLVACLATANVMAQTYWFESYERVVELTDRGEVEKAAKILDDIIEEHPYPMAGVRLPGNRFLDYLPHFQRARIEAHRGEYRRASHSLSVSEAFGAVTKSRKAMAEIDRLRRELGVHVSERKAGEGEATVVEARGIASR